MSYQDWVKEEKEKERRKHDEILDRLANKLEKNQHVIRKLAIVNSDSRRRTAKRKFSLTPTKQGVWRF